MFGCAESSGAFHSTKIPENFKTGKTGTRISRESFPENPEIVKFPESEPFNRKFRNSGSKNKPNGYFRKQIFENSGTLREVLLLRKIRKMLFQSSLKIFGNSNQNIHPMESTLGVCSMESYHLKSRDLAPLIRQETFHCRLTTV